MASAFNTCASVQKILIVDDNAPVRSSLHDWLRSSFPDFEFLEGEDGERAVQLAAQHQPRLVLMDIGLPGISGLEAARAILASQPATKVVILSIHDEARYRADADEIGASAFVSKADMRLGLIPAIVRALSSEDEG